MNDIYIKRSCRLCNSQDLISVFKLNDSPICDQYLTTIQLQKFYDLDLMYCKECGFTQINSVIVPSIIYNNYTYVSIESLGLVNHYKKYYNSLKKIKNLNENSLIIDIGCNDATLLNFFQKDGSKVLGIELPLKAFNGYIENNYDIEVLNISLNKNTVQEIVEKYGKANMITINNLFSNIDNLYDTTKNIISLLDDDGIFVIESSYLLDMLENKIFDFIYHEHLSYLSILPLSAFFEKFEMRLFSLKKTDIKGGSMRYHFCKINSQHKLDDCSLDLINKEKRFNIGLERFSIFKDYIDNVKKRLLDYLNKNLDNEIVGFGASATTTTFISYFSLEKYIDYLVDNNEDKTEKYSPGYHIPVYNTTVLQKKKRRVIIIFAWRFSMKIVPQLQNSYNTIIMPFPEFKIISPLFKEIKNGS